MSESECEICGELDKCNSDAHEAFIAQEKLGKARELIGRLVEAINSLKKDINEMMPYANKGGVVFPICLDCGMPAVRGVSSCLIDQALTEARAWLGKI